MKSFLKGFVYAGKGIFYCLRNERNMRIHLCFTAYMFGILTVFDFFEVSRAEYAVLLALCGLVMALEAVNTAIERAVNLVTLESHPLAGAAKDVAAGAVLIGAIFSVITGVVILFQPGAFKAMYEYYSCHMGMLILLILSLILSLAFVFIPKQTRKDKETDK